MNNSYLGLIRQAQRGFQMDFEVSLAFDNINSAGGRAAMASITSRSPRGWAARRCGCKSPNEFKAAFAQAQGLMEEHQVPVVIEFILERVTNISMGTEIDNVSEFEEILPRAVAHARRRLGLACSTLIPMRSPDAERDRSCRGLPPI